MPIKKYTTEQIIGLLRDAEILVSEGNTVAMASKKLGISEQSYYRWRKEYGGMKVSHAKRLKDLEKENSRLKKLLAEAELDKAILKEAASGNF
jgi:transposase-like protein